MREYQMEVHPQIFQDQARRSLIWIWNSAWASHFNLRSEYIYYSLTTMKLKEVELWNENQEPAEKIRERES